MHIICIQYFHLVNGCRLVFFKYHEIYNLQKMPILMPNFSRLISGSLSRINENFIELSKNKFVRTHAATRWNRPQSES